MDSVNKPTVDEGVVPCGVKVRINDQEVTGVIKASVDSNALYHSDHYDVTFDLYESKGFGIEYWGSIDPTTDKIICEVLFLSRTRQWVSMIKGELDHIRIDALSGLAVITGRDFSGTLIDTKTQEAYINLTSSEIVRKIAVKHGFPARVQDTTTKVGRYYQQDHTHLKTFELSKEVTEWDMLVKLAKIEVFDLYFVGDQLNFVNRDTKKAPRWIVICPTASYSQGLVTLGQSNVTSLDFERGLTFSKDITVTVHSWHSKLKKKITAKAIKQETADAARNAQQGNFGSDGFTKVARVGGAKAANANTSNGTTNYDYTIPNLTEAEATDRAAQILHDLTTHERLVNWSEVGSTDITPRMAATVIGPAGSWQDDYVITSIRREVSQSGGFHMSCTAKHIGDALEITATSA